LLERFSLEQLEDTFLLEGETTMLQLTFSREMGVVHFALLFDSPLQLLRARRVLESWTRHDIEENRPVVVLSSDTSNKPAREVAAGSWGVLPGPLTRNVLDRSLGTLWNEVVIRLSRCVVNLVQQSNLRAGSGKKATTLGHGIGVSSSSMAKISDIGRLAIDMRGDSHREDSLQLPEIRLWPVRIVRLS
jgi:hypothetical protein